MSLLKSWFPATKGNSDSVKEIFDLLLGTLRESALVVGEDSRVIASNEAAYAAFGRGNGLLEGKRLPEVIRDLTLHEAFRLAIEENQVSEIELELIGNETRKYAVRVTPILISETRAAVGYFHDITQVDRLERMRQEFLSNVSHELRTPLTSIIAFAETLEGGAIEDRENNLRFLKVIQRNAERMHRLIDDILELSSIESGSVSIEKRPCQLRDLLTDAFTSLSGKASDNQVSLVNAVAEETRVIADPVRLEQMLINLIDNAIKFNREDGSVTVSCEQNDSASVISVSDTGEGISSEHLPRLFERFYRTDRARSREIGGTGLGLAICKHLAILHGGEVSVESTLGQGSVFKIELPRE